MYFSEFNNSKVLQAGLAVLSFVYFLAFSSWVGSAMTSLYPLENFGHRCQPYFQNCDSFYFLTALPEGYSQTVFYMILFALLAWIIYLLTEKRWYEAQLLLIIPYIWHILMVLFLTESVAGNYEYYIIVFGTILLLLPHKEFFAKLALVLLYVLSTVAKIHPAWIVGGYFTNLQLGLPLFPEWSIPLFTNSVICMEMIGAWYLLSGNKYLQRCALFFFILFHLYSGILVEYRYPATALPMILVLFGPWYSKTPVPFTHKSLVGWGFVVVLIFLQFSPKLIEGDEKLTLEGNRYGLYMFESNHQCISSFTTYFLDGSFKEQIRVRTSARNRCAPYSEWFNINERCERDSTIEKISWRFDHSINGESFLRIVDTQDACNLEFKPFEHNEWIKTHEDKPPVIGKPVMNFYL
jgi:hypothetical protein